MIAYSPTCRGWLTGDLRKSDDLAPNDWRRNMPRFMPDVFDDNFKLVLAVEEIAKRKGVSVGQVAVSWVCHQGAIPIPDSTKPERVKENCKPATLTEEDKTELQKILDTLPIFGDRYGGDHEKLLNG